MKVIFTMVSLAFMVQTVSAGEFCASLSPNKTSFLNASKPASIRVNIARPVLGTAEVDGKVCIGEEEPCAFVHGEASPGYGNASSKLSGTLEGEREALEVAYDVENAFLVVPDVCNRSSPNYNGPLCLNLISGTVNNADYSDAGDIENISVEQKLYLPTRANEGKAETRIFVQTSHSSESFYYNQLFSVKPCSINSRNDRLEMKRFASELDRITHIK